jgi:hypothetical protein
MFVGRSYCGVTVRWESQSFAPTAAVDWVAQLFGSASAFGNRANAFVRQVCGSGWESESISASADRRRSYRKKDPAMVLQHMAAGECGESYPRFQHWVQGCEIALFNFESALVAGSSVFCECSFSVPSALEQDLSELEQAAVEAAKQAINSCSATYSRAFTNDPDELPFVWHRPSYYQTAMQLPSIWEAPIEARLHQTSE